MRPRSQDCSTRRHLFVALVLALLFVVPVGGAHAQDTGQQRAHLTLADIHASNKLTPEGFQGGRWASEGPVITYIETDDETGATNLISYNLETDARTQLIDGSQLHAGDVDRLVAIEDYQYAADGSKVLIYTDSERVWRLNTKGYYYVYDLDTGTLTPISDRSAGFQMFAKFSPDGNQVAFVRDRNLYLVDLDTMAETQLTDDGADGSIINGTSDWVYEEEFGLRDGWAWSPDSRHIAFFKLDETHTRDFFLADLRGQYPEQIRFRYPKAGEANSEIEVGVIDVASGATRFFDTDTWNAGGDDHEYIPQMGWTPQIDGKYRVWLFRMNRDQNQLDLMYGDPDTGQIDTALHEESDAWLEVETGFSDLDVGQLTYLDDGKHFVWISERDGFRHLYLYDDDGTLVHQITHGEWDVTDFQGLDEATGMVYFVAAKASPLERQLYRIALSGDGEPERITERTGWHDVNMSGDHKYYIDTFSNVDTPPEVSLHHADGGQISVLQDNDALAERVAAYHMPVPEFTQVAGADGTMLNAYVIKPTDFDARRQYPLLMYVYGGPGSQTVRNAWPGAREWWLRYLAEELDILVASVDNRGTGARGTAFKTATYRHLGRLEPQDQIAAAQHFGEMPYVDAGRIGIWGWSYGGYMTLMSMLTGAGPQTFTMGISVAPVTDWRQYDTIYTERYMSTPQHNQEGYDAGAPVNYAGRLADDQDLLLIQGDMDDNVHFQNSIHMIDAFIDADKHFDLMVYPGRNHGIFGGNTRLHLHQLMTDYIREHLVGTGEVVQAGG